MTTSELLLAIADRTKMNLAMVERIKAQFSELATLINDQKQEIANLQMTIGDLQEELEHFHSEQYDADENAEYLYQVSGHGWQAWCGEYF